jgi:hypothetical protein
LSNSKYVSRRIVGKSARVSKIDMQTERPEKTAAWFEAKEKWEKIEIRKQ